MADQIIIALSGRKGAGKNTVAEFIPKYYFARSMNLRRTNLTARNVLRTAKTKYFDTIIHKTFLKCSWNKNTIDDIKNEVKPIIIINDIPISDVDYIFFLPKSFVIFFDDSITQKYSNLERCFMFNNANNANICDAIIPILDEIFGF